MNKIYIENKCCVKDKHVYICFNKQETEVDIFLSWLKFLNNYFAFTDDVT